MNIKNIIQQGEPAKYQIMIEHEGFSTTDNDVSVRLYWGMRGQQLVIQKEDMLRDEDGRLYIQFDTKEMLGLVQAEVTYYRTDSDYEAGSYPEVERQPLCYVNPSSKMPMTNCGIDDFNYDGMHVTFLRTEAVGVKTLYFTLRDIVGVYLYDSLGRQLKALKKPRVS